MMDKARYGGQRTRHRQEKEAVHAWRCLQRFFLMFRAHHIPMPESG